MRAPIAEPDLGDQLIDPHPLWLAAGQLERQDNVFLSGEHRQQVEELEDETDVAAPKLRQLRVAEVPDLRAVDPDVALGWPVETGEDMHESRLAGPGRPHHRDQRALGHRQRHAPESIDGCLAFPVAPGQVTRRHHHRRPGQRHWAQGVYCECRLHTALLSWSALCWPTPDQSEPSRCAGASVR